ncbi:uncharacterized protein BDZ99DRAFT_464460 [Mytilinidion resinicola]|uniref:LSM domain-containing protein n=1 Tax=Mytilinidion resinicola TaxID=574789 RepID=A0A6A6YID8_9PEZI|nr:uncharacterized protein BDZ99DRAFT_464460 [Mytilinidion resinicola]KAF2808612.1 hypothetical protein BDZ99DRAFT_464460 [Mytilinidion resinicola]
MNNQEATAYLEQLIGRSLRLYTSDSRIFVGQMKCTDKDRNIILALTYEYRQPSEATIRKTVESSGNPSAQVPLMSRYVGLVVVPGQYITRIEYEESQFSQGTVVP